MIAKTISYLVAGLVAGGVFAADPPAKRVTASPTPGEVARTRAFMREKMAYSHFVLEGITLEQYGLVVTNAQSMKNMTQSNLFYRVRNPEYIDQTAKFSKSLDRLVKAARNEKLNDATAAYNRVVRNCVDCHRWFRSAQRAFASEVSPERPNPVLRSYPLP